MISPRSGSNQILDVAASNIYVTIKRRKKEVFFSDNILQQPSKIEIWGNIEKLSVCGVSCEISENDYIREEVSPLFFEQSDYIVSAKSLVGASLYFDHSDKHIREAVTALDSEEPDRIGGVINFGNEVGYSNLIFSDDRGNRLLIEIEVFPSKLSYKEDYEAIRNDINEMVESAAIDFINSTYSLGDISRSRNNVPAIFFSLITQIFDKYYKAVKVIMQRPNHKLIAEHHIVPIHKMRRIDSHTIRWISNHSEMGTRRDGKIFVKKIIDVSKRIKYDTVENRLVKFMLMLTVKKLQDFKRKYIAGYRDPNRSADYNILRTINGMVAKINVQLKNPIFDEVSQLSGIKTMSLVFQMAPGYRELYRYFQLIQRGISFSGEVYRLSLKETSTLYEYWCFIKLVNIMKNKYTLLDDNRDVIKANRKGITVTLSKEKKSEVRFIDTKTGDKFELVYNPGEYPSDTVKQIPDNVLRLTKRKGKEGQYAGFQYIFDAKYKVEMNPDIYYPDKDNKPGPKVADINTMHRYRDAIVSKKGDLSEKLMFGAYVLFPYPYSEDEYRTHQFYKSIDTVNIGGIPFLPGKTQIAEELLTKLVGESDVSAFERIILPKGLEERIEKVDWSRKDVLVGSLSSREQWDHCYKNKYYYIPVGSFLASYHQADYIAIYQSRRLYGQDAGILYYGEVVNTEVIPRAEINDIKGHIAPSAKCYRFEIKEWLELDSKIEFEKEWVYYPRYTNLFLLKNSYTTFELFNVKSNVDYRLVYELRRIQTEIRVQDHPRELFVKVNNFISVYNDEEYIRVFCDGQELFRESTKIFAKSPSTIFESIKKCILRSEQ